MPLDNNTLAAFTAHQSAFQAAEVSEGISNKWPDEGVHNAYINAIEVKADGEFRMGGGLSIPATEVTFEYELQDDPENPDNPLRWRGATFQLPDNPDDIPADKPGHKQRYDIEMGRLKSHLSVLLGDQFADNLPADMQAAVAKVESGSTVAAVYCQYKPDKRDPDRIYKKDFLRELISG